MRLFFLFCLLPLLAFGQGPSSTLTSAPTSAPATPSTLPLAMLHPAPPKAANKNPNTALVLSLSASAVSYVGLGFGARVLISGFTRGVTFGMLGLTGSVISPGLGKIYLKKGGGPLLLTTGLRFVASTAAISGLILAGDQIDGCGPTDCPLVWGGTAALLGLGVYDIATTR